MGPSELLSKVAGVLDRMKVEYFVTGSVATMAYSESRMTNDVDIVVALPLSRIAEFCESFPPQEYYVSVEAAKQAILHQSQFNIIHPESGFKADIIIPSRTDFNRSRFSRVRRLRAVPGLDVAFSSPEDAIIMKMQYYKDGESEKHVRDIATVMQVNGDTIDRGYIETWAEELDLMVVWKAILTRLG